MCCFYKVAVLAVQEHSSSKNDIHFYSQIISMNQSTTMEYAEFNYNPTRHTDEIKHCREVPKLPDNTSAMGDARHHIEIFDVAKFIGNKKRVTRRTMVFRRHAYLILSYLLHYFFHIILVCQVIFSYVTESMILSKRSGNRYYVVKQHKSMNRELW